MQEIKIFLLDLNPSSGLGCLLREVLELNVTPSIYLKEEAPEGSGFDAFFPELSTIISNFEPSLVFLVLPPGYLSHTTKLIQSFKGKPLIAVFEGFKSEEMIELLKLGVSDFIVPPLKAVDVLPRVWRLLEQRRSGDSLIHALKKKIGLKQLIGKSFSFLSELEKIPVVAQCNSSVLISGETGTGKELFARAIHYLSPRASKPFIPTSCGAIPLELAENELFGHVQGAFTSASSPQPGLIQEAQGGSLFLDEIDCLPLLTQVKLLRFLQEKEYKQLGSAKVHHADVRVIAATNVELEKTAREGRFRRDLYYRVNIIPLTLPPLRDRKEDIPLLADHFSEKHASDANGKTKRLSPDAIQKLMTHDWPGNVRELENVIERAVIFSKGATIQSTDVLLPCAEEENSRQSFKEAKARAVEQFEKKYIQDLLITHQGNISRAAEAVHKNRRAFWELIRKYEIDVTSLKAFSKPG